MQWTADASTVWYLQIEEGTQSVLPLNPSVWVTNIGMGGTGASGNAVTDFLPFYNNAGQQFVPKVWGLLAVCVGTGHGVFHVSTNEDFSNFTNASAVSFPVCNGEPTLSIIRHPPASQTRAVMAMPSGNMLWQVLLLGCTSADVAACK